jgi:hypothetical protein
MNYEPPDFTKDAVNSGSGSSFQNSKGTFYSKPQFQDCSPLLRTSPNKHFNKNGPNNQNRNNNNFIKPNPNFNNKTSLYNRLGHRNPYRSNSLDSAHVEGDNQGQRNFYRKRNSDTNIGPQQNKRKWNNQRAPYHVNSNKPHTNSVQDRMNRIRTYHEGENDQVNDSNSSVEINTSNFNESQELDATDITVEVVNSTAHVEEETHVTKFKMVLDPKKQTAIKLIQQKRKDKQVIFPFPVTPNVTGITLNERFSML